ncbi:hypothetical protein LOZ66_000011 [Ophidiomyces ophidiicola]|nr:hypothetical protein LOZ66_000011 [Ophidiomyces ophidiicola]
MRCSSLALALCLGGHALASPIEKRDYVTELTVVTTTVYHYPGGMKPTPPVQRPQKLYPHWPGGWSGWFPWPQQPGLPPRPTPPPPKPQPPAQPQPQPQPQPEPQPQPQPEPQPQPQPEPQPQPPPRPSPPPETPAPPQSPEGPGSPPPKNDYQATALYQHNIHRRNHSAEALTWNDRLESTARQLAQTCVYEHDTKIGGGGYGQNIGYQSGFDSLAQMITDSMYNGEAPLFEGLYGQANPGGNFFKWGHFTQIVWKSTKHVACYTHRCPTLRVGRSGSTVNNANFMVCNYGPPGNYAGEYDRNVGKPLGHPIVTG